MTTEAPAPPGHFRLATEVWAIEYEERSPDTMIRTTNMRDLPARGRFWIEPESGRVLMTELVRRGRAIRGTINVNYQSNPLLGLLVPVEMRERYDKLRDRSVVEVSPATGASANFRCWLTRNWRRSGSRRRIGDGAAFSLQEVPLGSVLTPIDGHAAGERRLRTTCAQSFEKIGADRVERDSSVRDQARSTSVSAACGSVDFGDALPRGSAPRSDLARSRAAGRRAAGSAASRLPPPPARRCERR